MWVEPRPGIYYIVSAKTGLVVDLDVQNNKILCYKRNGGRNQQWEVLKGGIIRNVETGKVLDVWSYQSEESGERIDDLITYDMNGGINQKWQFASDGVIQSAAKEAVLDVWFETKTRESDGKPVISQAPILLYKPHGGPNQVWHLESLSGKPAKTTPLEDREFTPGADF